MKVTSVEFESGNAEITEWALRPNPAAEGKNSAGDVPGTLAGKGIGNTEGLTRVCDGHGNSYELALQLRAGESSTDGDGVVVSYTSAGRDGSLTLPDRVVLCVSRTSRMRVKPPAVRGSTEECRGSDHRRPLTRAGHGQRIDPGSTLDT